MIQYKITKPCHQNWDKMTPTAQGKFCAHCKKQVYDLTKEKMVNNLPEIFCGRIESHKVANEIIFKKLLFKQNPIRYVAISLLLLFTKNVKAQLLNKINFSTDSIPQQNMDDTITKNITISGTLLDEKTKETIPFANLTVTDSLSNQIGMGTTDIDGAYNLIFDKALICGKSISIMASYQSYDTLIVKNIPIISLKQSIFIRRETYESVSVGMLIRTIEVVIENPRYSVETPKLQKDEVFVSEFDRKPRPTRDDITKNNLR